MLTGLLTLGRGVAYLQAAPERKATACPFCADNHDEIPGRFSSNYVK
jgi:hypothetical protein